MRTSNWILIISISWLAGCGQPSPEQSSDQPPTGAIPTIGMDTTDATLLPFQQAVLAYQDDQFRQSTDLIMAGLKHIEILVAEAPDSIDLSGFRQSIRELTQLAARISRYEISSDREMLDRDFVRARLEMAHLLLIATNIQGQALVILSQRLAFCLGALEAALPYLPGETNQELRPLLQEGRQLGETASREELLAFLLRSQLFIEKHKTEISG